MKRYLATLDANTLNKRLQSIRERFKHDPKYVSNESEVKNLNKLINFLSEQVKRDIATVDQMVELLEDCKNAFVLAMNKNLTNDAIEKCFHEYLKHLNGQSIYVLSSAINHIICKDKFFPSISRILDECREVENNFATTLRDARFLKKKVEVSMLPRTKNFYQETMQVLTKNSEKLSKDDFILKNFYLHFIHSEYPEIFS